jgi:ATP:ADP antiporter, AAA family
MKPGEFRRTGLAFAAFFLLLSGYYVLRPVRDAMGVETGVENLQWLFTGTFLFTLLIVPIFGWVAQRIPRARLIPLVYGFVIADLIGFMVSFAGGITRVSAAAFFIWLSVFNLFVVSLF